MSIDKYLAALDSKVRALQGVVTSWSIQREIDANLGIGFIKGHIGFVDGSRLEFSEQLPTERRRYRLNYMDAQDNLVVRWDSAPHHKGLGTFPFHRHTPEGIAEYPAITLLEAIDEVIKLLEV
jgi:hypothetical protein